MPYTKKKKGKKNSPKTVKSVSVDPIATIPALTKFSASKSLTKAQLSSYGKYLKSKRRSKI